MAGWGYCQRLSSDTANVCVQAILPTGALLGAFGVCGWVVDGLMGV